MIPCSARCPNKIVNGRCINEITVAPASYTDEEWAECMEDMGYEPDKIPSRKDMVVAGYFDIFMETRFFRVPRGTHIYIWDVEGLVAQGDSESSTIVRTRGAVNGRLPWLEKEHSSWVLLWKGADGRLRGASRATCIPLEDR